MKLKIGLVAALLLGGAATAVYAADRLEPARVSALLKTRLPKTQVSAIDCEKVAKLAKEKECQYIVLHSTWKCIGTLEDYQYQKVKTVDGYDIYLLEGADIKIPQ